MEPYPQYKNSGIEWIGDIPDSYAIKKLKFVADANPSNIDKKSKDNEDSVLLCNYVDVYKNEYINHHLDFMKATATHDQICKFILEKDDVIATKDSETPDDIGNPALVTETFDNVVCGYHLTHIKPQQINGRYLFRYMQSKYIQSYFEVSANGITRYGLGVDKFNSALVLNPPLKDQQQIATYLDHKTQQIDTLIAKKKRLIELLKDERTAVINEAVTKGIDPDVQMKDSGIEWLGQVPAHWSIKKIKRSIIIRGGQVDPRLSEYSSMLLIAPNHIERSTGNLLKLESAKEQGAMSGKYMFHEGDVLYSKIRPELSKACIAPNDGLCSADMYAIEPIKNNNSMYILYILLCDVFTKLAVDMSMRVAMPKINREDLSNIIWYFPPFDEQSSIATHIDKETTRIDTIITKTDKEIELLKEYRTALISEVVTGKIDVRNWKEPE